MPLFFDSETFSPTPLKWGAYKYMEQAECMLASWAVDKGDIRLQDFTVEPKLNDELEYWLYDTDEPIVCHNSAFDRLVLRRALRIPEKLIPPERFRCTMVRALAHGLPGGLDAIGNILGLSAEDRKLKTGKQYINLFCKPRPKNSKIQRATRLTHPKEWAGFCEYAKQDIPPMREAYRLLPKWNFDPDGEPGSPGYEEAQLWFLDQKINDRGIYVDVPFAEAAIEAVKRAQKRLGKQIRELTDDEVASATQRDQLLAHILESYGVALPDLRKDTLERRLNDPELPEGVKELIRVRLQAAASSTSKYAALTRSVGQGDRLRGTQQFNGASRTRRYAGRLFQPQNLPRPTLSLDEIDLGILSIKDAYEAEVFDNVMKVASEAVRGVIIAPPGKKLVVADLANIEGRAGAWQALEEWKLQAFRDYDLGIGQDLYKIAYGKAFNVDPASIGKNSMERQIGKVAELFSLYEGGVGAWVTGALTYRIDLDKLADATYKNAPEWAVAEAEKFWAFVQKKKLRTYGLEKRIFMACDIQKRLWRKPHAMTVSLWKELRSAVVEAITNPGSTVRCRRYVIKRSGSWLRVRLPSGKFLCYLQPEVDEAGTISYMGVNQYTRKWQRITTYGGKLLENATQAIAGDIMKAAMPVAESLGYEIVLTVHDEIVAEAPDDPAFNAEHLSSLLVESSKVWTQDMPLAAEGAEMKRYHK